MNRAIMRETGSGNVTNLVMICEHPSCLDDDNDDIVLYPTNLQNSRNFKGQLLQKDSYFFSKYSFWGFDLKVKQRAPKQLEMKHRSYLSM